MHKLILFFLCLFSLCFAGCENTDVDMLLVTDAGIDAVKAVTLSDKAVQRMAARASAYADKEKRIAPPGSRYAQRLRRIVGEHLREGNITFNYKVYLAQEVNAFAMADGTIRVYSGLMDMLTDDELRFVVGHEMGHVALQHIHKKLKLAYASSAVRKAVAATDSTAGEIARSQLGGFVQKLMGAQFSQLEEKEADDYGLAFMKEKGYAPQAAVSALQKLATLGNGHSFLSSHPAPGKRAERLQLQLEGKALSIAEQKQEMQEKSKGILRSVLHVLQTVFHWLVNLLKSLL
ncbi:MAG: M48 family metallopeptidase [Candidatus Electrothrix sp. YB6]